MLIKGTGYAYIERYNGEVVGLHFIPFELVTVIPPLQLNLPAKYKVVGLNVEVEASDMIVLHNFTYDGIYGLSVVKVAAQSLGIATACEQQAKGFFEGGGNLSGILTVNSSLTDKQKRDIKQSWRSNFNPETGTPGGVAVLEGNMTYSPIAVSPEDQELLSSRQWSVVEIARWLRISPVKLGDLSKSSYNTVEAVNLAFVSDTLQPILSKLELELTRKLIPSDQHENLSLAFDTAALLKADKQSQANYFQTLFNIGVLSPNDIRKELNLSEIEGGNAHLVQMNLSTLANIVKGLNVRPEQGVFEPTQEAQPE